MGFDISIVEKQMQGILEHTSRDFSTLKVGQARADFLDTVQVEVYGQYMPVKHIATISVLDNFSLSVSPFDKSNQKEIIKAIQEANLGVSVIAEATGIRVVMPKITEERRKEYVKILNKYAEDGKIAIRNARREANDKIKIAKNNSEISEDEAKREENAVQKLTDKFVNEIEQLASKKGNEILRV